MALNLGFGVSIHSLSYTEQGNLYRNIAMCKSRVSKRNIVSNEICGALLGAKTLQNLLQPLIYDYEDQELSIFMLHDSTCF